MVFNTFYIAANVIVSTSECIRKSSQLLPYNTLLFLFSTHYADKDEYYIFASSTDPRNRVCSDERSIRADSNVKTFDGFELHENYNGGDNFECNPYTNVNVEAKVGNIAMPSSDHMLSNGHRLPRSQQTRVS